MESKVELTDAGVARAPHARAVRDPASQGHGARVHRRVLGRARRRRLSLRRLRRGALPLGHEVRVGQRLAELLRADDARQRRHGDRHELRDGPHRGDVRDVRRPSRPRLRRRAGTDRAALLHQLLRARSRAHVLTRVTSCCRAAPAEEMFRPGRRAGASSATARRGWTGSSGDMVDVRERARSLEGARCSRSGAASVRLQSELLESGADRGEVVELVSARTSRTRSSSLGREGSRVESRTASPTSSTHRETSQPADVVAAEPGRLLLSGRHRAGRGRSRALDPAHARSSASPETSSGLARA